MYKPGVPTGTEDEHGRSAQMHPRLHPRTSKVSPPGPPTLILPTSNSTCSPPMRHTHTRYAARLGCACARRASSCCICCALPCCACCAAARSWGDPAAAAAPCCAASRFTGAWPPGAEPGLPASAARAHQLLCPAAGSALSSPSSPAGAPCCWLCSGRPPPWADSCGRPAAPSGAKGTDRASAGAPASGHAASPAPAAPPYPGIPIAATSLE